MSNTTGKHTPGECWMRENKQVIWKCESCGKETTLDAVKFLNLCLECGEPLVPLPYIGKKHRQKPNFRIVEYGTDPDGKPIGYAIKNGSDDIANLGASDQYANLLSSAPELLEALKKLYRQFDTLDLVFEKDDQTAMDVARWAIAKAEGRD